MRPYFLAGITSLAALAATVSLAQPSYDCSGSLNRTERTICNDADLSAQDFRMVDLFRQARRTLDSAAEQDFLGDQRTWLAWRNSCDADAACIGRRYSERITDLTLMLPADTGPFIMLDMQIATPGNDPNRVVDRRVTPERYEVEYADGRVEWQSLQGGSFGTDYPDGTQDVYSAQQVPGDAFPALPGSYAAWGDSIETSLLIIIDGFLNEADRAEYRAMQSSKPFSQRIPDHIRVIDFLAAQ